MKSANKDTDIHQKADKNSKVLSRLKSAQEVELILAGKNGWDKVRLENGMTGWADATALGNVDFIEARD